MRRRGRLGIGNSVLGDELEEGARVIDTKGGR